MPKVTEAALEVRRGQILDAAIACFARNGFHQTTMSDIAREAGISPGLTYRYFPSKEDLIEASAEARRQARAQRFSRAAQEDDGLRALDELVDLYLARAGRPEPLMRLGAQLYGEALHNRRVRDSVREAWDDVITRLEPIVRRAQDEGAINPALDANAIARLLMVTVEGLALHKVIDPTVDVSSFAAALKMLYRGNFGQGGALETGSNRKSKSGRES
jgi:AcrR family transcriptional regulator